MYDQCSFMNLLSQEIGPSPPTQSDSRKTAQQAPSQSPAVETPLPRGEGSARKSAREAKEKTQSAPDETNEKSTHEKPHSHDLNELPDFLEISECESLQVCGTNLHLYKTDKTEPRNEKQFKFDAYSYLQLIRCLRDLCFFSAGPSKSQFEAMTQFEKRAIELKLCQQDFETKSRPFLTVLNFAATGLEFKDHESFLIQQYLILNLPLLYAYMELDRLLP